MAKVFFPGKFEAFIDWSRLLEVFNSINQIGCCRGDDDPSILLTYTPRHPFT
jgi:hypothetical protein